MISDSVSGSICIGGIISRISQHFGITLKTSESIPYSLLDEKFIKNSNQFKKVNNLFVWKNEEALALFLGKEEGGGGEGSWGSS